MTRWDLLAVLAALLLVIAAVGVDWRLGVAVSGVAVLAGWWIWQPIDETPDEEG